MQFFTRQFSIATHGKGLYEFTREVERWVLECRVETALLTLFCRHTSASLIIQENADPDVVADLRDFFERLVPEGDRRYRHQDEGDDDMPAHIRAALTQSSISIPVVDSRLAFGTWQGIYLFEHRSVPHRRGVAAMLVGAGPLGENDELD